MPRPWTADDVLEMGRSYKAACVLAAAADLELFDVLVDGPMSAGDIAGRLDADLRATMILLDALVALELLDKCDQRYSVVAGVADVLTAVGSASVLAMTQHQANCLRRWTRLARVVRDGQPLDRQPSIRGENADQESFIGAMDDICASIAPGLIKEIRPLGFSHMLDVGGASGTWTIAFLRANPDATATLYDLPHVLPLARKRLTNAGVLDRVRLVGGDFLEDRLPRGADLAWVSAIVHQNSRTQNRRLFTNVFEALSNGGQIIIRDVVMAPSRTTPVEGALFAINMLVATEGGGTFTFDELRDDLTTAGFLDAAIVRSDESMNSLVRAVRQRQR